MLGEKGGCPWVPDRAIVCLVASWSLSDPLVPILPLTCYVDPLGTSMPASHLWGTFHLKGYSWPLTSPAVTSTPQGCYHVFTFPCRGLSLPSLSLFSLTGPFLPRPTVLDLASRFQPCLTYSNFFSILVGTLGLWPCLHSICVTVMSSSFSLSRNPSLGHCPLTLWTQLLAGLRAVMCLSGTAGISTSPLVPTQTTSMNHNIKANNHFNINLPSGQTKHQENKTTTLKGNLSSPIRAALAPGSSPSLPGSYSPCPSVAKLTSLALTLSS